MAASLDDYTWTSPQGEVTMRAAVHAELTPQFAVKLVKGAGDTWTPQLVKAYTSKEMATAVTDLRLAVRRSGQPRYDLVFELFPELKKRTRHLAGTLSGGQQQMLSLARGLLNDNELLLVDEPTKGLAPVAVREVVEVLERAAGQTTVLMVEQNLAVARRLADHIAVMVDGAVVLREPAGRLAEDDGTVRAYLSVGSAVSGASS